jgi:Suppressor of fused protein (SUFU)
MKWPFRSRIVRHAEPTPREFVGGDSPSLELIVEHIKTHIGDPGTVIHEIASEYVHVDVHVVAPRPDRNFYTLITSGMSAAPMTVPKQVRGQGMEFAELVLCLPNSWNLDTYDILSGKTSEKDWPVLWLRQLARFPHQYKTWFWWGHSMPNGDPAMPLAPDTGLCGWVLLEPKLVPDAFKLLKRTNGTQILFFAAVPVYREEMAMKIADGAGRLEELFGECKITELVDPNRINVGAKPNPTKQ